MASAQDDPCWDELLADGDDTELIQEMKTTSASTSASSSIPPVPKRTCDVTRAREASVSGYGPLDSDAMKFYRRY